MGIAQALYYDFKKCDCLNVEGEQETIPAGRYIVTEGEVVTVNAGTKTYELDEDTFKSLRRQNIVTIPLL
ncbi:hypothetical protein JET64_01330 [Pseudomonas putida]|nr:hypothetical protein [Pseudomonas putida]